MQSGRILPVMWPCTFVMVNTYNICRILQERSSTVRLSEDQEKIYAQYFMSHGVSPRQFETIFESAEICTYKKGEAITKQGEDQEHVYLVIRGHTRATSRGRRLSAASFKEAAKADSEEASAACRYGASSAWIGEMSFLEEAWKKDQEKLLKPKKSIGGEQKPVEGSEPGKASELSRNMTKLLTQRLSKMAGGASSSDAAKQNDGVRHPRVNISTKRTVVVADRPVPPSKIKKSPYTIVAHGGDDECVVLRWSHEDMEKLMSRSADMKNAMLRAMTAAVVGKVIHFTASRSQEMPTTWSSITEEWNSKIRSGRSSNSQHVSPAQMTEVAEIPTKTATSLVPTTMSPFSPPSHIFPAVINIHNDSDLLQI